MGGSGKHIILNYYLPKGEDWFHTEHIIMLSSPQKSSKLKSPELSMSGKEEEKNGLGSGFMASTSVIHWVTPGWLLCYNDVISQSQSSRSSPISSNNPAKKFESSHEVILFLRNTLPNFLPFSCFCTEEREISRFLTELKYHRDLNHETLIRCIRGKMIGMYLFVSV